MRQQRCCFSFCSFFVLQKRLYCIKGRIMKQEYYDAVEANPVIAAVKDQEGLETCCRLEEIQVVFILFGNVCTISEIVRKVKEAGKMAVVHIDLIGGLSSKEIAVDFIKDQTEADGIISTKPPMIERGRKLGMFTILRYFLIDSLALANIRQPQHNVKPDMIEILPGLMPGIIRRICKSTKTPIIAGGLIEDKEAVMAALSAGAIAVSTTNPGVWEL